MTSIYDIPYEDIQEFLLENYINFKDKDDAYNTTLILLKDKKAIGHTIRIIEWMMAHNLLIRNVKIPNYTTNEINKMSQNEINQLAKLLKMQGNNLENIKNILRYLHKLDEKNIILLPDINEIISKNLEELEISQIDLDTIKVNNVINLLKTHRNKALIRKLIYDNMEKIIFYNFLITKFKNLDKLPYFEELTYSLPKSVILELLKINEKRILKNHNIEEINEFIDYLEEIPMIIDIHRDIETLADFLIDLIKINEIGLAKKVFDIANEYKFFGTLLYTGYYFDQYLVYILAYQEDNVFDKLLEFIGEDNFIKNFEIFIITKSNIYNTRYVKNLLNILVKYERYELLLKVLDLLILRNYKGSSPVINMMLPNLQKAIELNNNNLLIKYLDILNLALDGELNIFRLGENRVLKNRVNELIKNAEQDSY
jgi:hypothetical protein